MIRLVVLDLKLALRSLAGMLGDRSTRMKLLILLGVLVLMHAVAYYAVTRFAPDEATRKAPVRPNSRRAVRRCSCCPGR